MKAPPVTAARQKSGRLPKDKLKGEGNYLMIDGKTVLFRPMKLCPEDYDVSRNEFDKFLKAANQELDADHKAGRLKPFTGKLRRT